MYNFLPNFCVNPMNWSGRPSSQNIGDRVHFESVSCEAAPSAPPATDPAPKSCATTRSFAKNFRSCNFARALKLIETHPQHQHTILSRYGSEAMTLAQSRGEKKFVERFGALKHACEAARSERQMVATDAHQRACAKHALQCWELVDVRD